MPIDKTDTFNFDVNKRVAEFQGKDLEEIIASVCNKMSDLTHERKKITHKLRDHNWDAQDRITREKIETYLSKTPVIYSTGIVISIAMGAFAPQLKGLSELAKVTFEAGKEHNAKKDQSIEEEKTHFYQRIKSSTDDNGQQLHGSERRDDECYRKIDEVRRMAEQIFRDLTTSTTA